jgi:hypothetical protein
MPIYNGCASSTVKALVKGPKSMVVGMTVPVTKKGKRANGDQKAPLSKALVDVRTPRSFWCCGVLVLQTSANISF